MNPRDDSKYMAMAMQLALKAQGQTSPNPLVGAVIVKNNQVIAQGFHRRCGLDHAEVDALKKAKARAQGATLYVTLEPCGHFGRTPPCIQAIIESGIKEVVVGTKDPNPVNNGKSIRALNRAGIKTRVGVLESDLRKMNESFFKFIRHQMPFIVIKCAQTLDGKVATATGSSKWITSQKTRALSHRLRDQFDAILVGINTVVKDNPYLDGSSKQKKLKKIILDPSLRISLNANVFKHALPSHVIVATIAKASRSKIAQLKAKGIDVILCPTTKKGIDLKWFFKQIALKEITSVLVEGGSRTAQAILSQGFADKIWIFMAPKIIGDQEALSAYDGLNIKDINKALQLKRVNVQLLGEDMFIEGYLK